MNYPDEKSRGMDFIIRYRQVNAYYTRIGSPNKSWLVPARTWKAAMIAAVGLAYYPFDRVPVYATDDPYCPDGGVPLSFDFGEMLEDKNIQQYGKFWEPKE